MSITFGRDDCSHGILRNVVTFWTFRLLKMALSVVRIGGRVEHRACIDVVMNKKSPTSVENPTDAIHIMPDNSIN
jgi:hypothetical protein